MPCSLMDGKMKRDPLAENIVTKEIVVICLLDRLVQDMPFAAGYSPLR